jgi:hypothetical protein
MTQAFNLAQLANNLNTSGQVDATDGLSGLIANSNLASSGTANSSNFLRGDRVWAPVVQRVLNIANWSYSSVYFQDQGTGNVDLPSPLGDGTANLTPSSTSSKIYCVAQINCGQVDTWRANYFRVYYSIGGGSWTQFGGFASLVYISGTSGGMQSVIFSQTLSPNTTSNVRIKIMQEGHPNGGSLLLNQNNIGNSTAQNNTINAASTITLMEIS